MPQNIYCAPVANACYLVWKEGSEHNSLTHLSQKRGKSAGVAEGIQLPANPSPAAVPKGVVEEA